MNSVRERVLFGYKQYMEIGEHKDLIAFCVDSESFEDWDEMEENDGNPVADFNELIVIVEKEWLFNLMRKDGINNPLEYLKNEYTSYESCDWFIEAKEKGKIVCIVFN